MTAKIGVFWVYEGEVIGRAINCEQGHMNYPGLMDSPDNHVDLWENEPGFLKNHPQLRNKDYMQVPRGRVLWNEVDQKAIVYMDKVLFQDKIKNRLRQFFSLEHCDVLWNTDPHYTTQADELEDLFGDGY